MRSVILRICLAFIGATSFERESRPRPWLAVSAPWLARRPGLCPSVVPTQQGLDRGLREMTGGFQCRARSCSAGPSHQIQGLGPRYPGNRLECRSGRMIRSSTTRRCIRPKDRTGPGSALLGSPKVDCRSRYPAGSAFRRARESWAAGHPEHRSGKSRHGGGRRCRSW